MKGGCVLDARELARKREVKENFGKEGPKVLKFSYPEQR